MLSNKDPIMRRYADLEIHIQKLQDAQYPVVLTLDVDGEQELGRGVLVASILPWVPSAVPADDGQRLFNLLFSTESLKKAWAQARGQAPLTLSPGSCCAMPTMGSQSTWPAATPRRSPDSWPVSGATANRSASGRSRSSQPSPTPPTSASITCPPSTWPRSRGR